MCHLQRTVKVQRHGAFLLRQRGFRFALSRGATALGRGVAALSRGIAALYGRIRALGRGRRHKILHQGLIAGGDLQTAHGRRLIRRSEIKAAAQGADHALRRVGVVVIPLRAVCTGFLIRLVRHRQLGLGRFSLAGLCNPGAESFGRFVNLDAETIGLAGDHRTLHRNDCIAPIIQSFKVYSSGIAFNIKPDASPLSVGTAADTGAEQRRPHVLGCVIKGDLHILRRGKIGGVHIFGI